MPSASLGAFKLKFSPVVSFSQHLTQHRSPRCFSGFRNAFSMRSSLIAYTERIYMYISPRITYHNMVLLLRLHTPQPAPLQPLAQNTSFLPLGGKPLPSILRLAVEGVVGAVGLPLYLRVWAPLQEQVLPKEPS